MQGLGGDNTLVHTPVGQSVLVHIVLRALMERRQCGFSLAGFQVKADKAAAADIGEQQLFAVGADFAKMHAGDVAGTNGTDEIAVLIQLKIAAQRERAHKAAAAQAAVDVAVLIAAAASDVAAEGNILIFLRHVLHKVQDNLELELAVSGFNRLFHNLSAVRITMLNIHKGRNSFLS